MENGILVEAKFEDLQEYLLQTEKLNKRQAISLADYLFQDDQDVIVLDDKKINEKYLEYNDTLRHIY